MSPPPGGETASIKRPVLLASISIMALSASGAPEVVGFQPNHPYDQGANDSIDLYILNPLVSQPLSPSLRISDMLGTKRIRLYDTQGQRSIPLTGLEGGAGNNDWAPALDELGQRMVFVLDRMAGPDVYLYQVATHTLSSFAPLVSDSADVEPEFNVHH